MMNCAWRCRTTERPRRGNSMEPLNDLARRTLRRIADHLDGVPMEGKRNGERGEAPMDVINWQNEAIRAAEADLDARFAVAR